MLRVKNGKIVSDKGKPVRLAGVNVGGWLMMEAYIMHAPNFPVKKLKKEFVKKNGKTALENFEKSFADNFIREEDFKNIARLGLNCVRVPFHHNLIEKTPYKYCRKGLSYLDKAVAWGKKYNLYIILDLHGACGAQNHDWHSDSSGEANLWQKKECRNRTYSLWEFLAKRYKDEDIVAGYDLLNEAVVADSKKLNTFYRELIKRIRKVDKNHILFVEGNNWAMDLDCLDEIQDHNYALSIHAYQPLDFTFNFVPQLKYPLKGYGKKEMKKLLSKYHRISKRRKVPILVGEFGVTSRDGLYGEDKWLKDMLSCCKDFGFHWTYWTYKAIKNSHFPDGVYSYMANPPWVSRQGPVMGWDIYPDLWREYKKDMVSSWWTKHFRENKIIIKVLKDAAK